MEKITNIKTNIKSNKKDFQNKSNIIHNNEYLIIGDYINNKTKIEIKHLLCGKTFQQRTDMHTSGQRCTYCYIKRRYTNSEFQKKSDTNNNCGYEIIGDYIDCFTKIEIRHIICGRTFHQIPSEHLSGRGCAHCYKTKISNSEDFQEKSNIIHNNEYLIIGDYINNKIKIEIKHLLCGCVFNQSPNSHLRGSGCPNCMESKGEKLIKHILTSFNINFIKEHRFENCKFKNTLPFDFYLPELNLCIEYNGIQHYEPINYFGGIQSLILQKAKDNIKYDFCKNNNLDLLVIKYNENIEDILNSFLIKSDF